jgi:hypothetical protein
VCFSGEPFEEWNDWIGVLPRKAKPCAECGRWLAPRDERVYQAQYVHYDEPRGGYVSCLHCHELTEWLSRQCEGVAVGRVLEDVYEHTRDRDYMQDEEIELHFWLHINVARLHNHALAQWKRPDGTLRPVPNLAFAHVPPSERAAARAAAGPRPTRRDIYP